MSTKASNFVFGVENARIDPQLDYMAGIGSNIADRARLLEALGNSLQFPKYFGHNWDALLDCLRDLSWIKQYRVVIVHQDIPLSSLQEQKDYLEVLSDSILDWNKDKIRQHEIIVVFPKSVEPEVQKITKLD